MVDKWLKRWTPVWKVSGSNPTPTSCVFFLTQENLLQLLHSTQVRMGTWPFGSFLSIVKSPNRQVWLPMCYVFATGRGSNCVQALRAWYALDRRYVKATFCRRIRSYDSPQVRGEDSTALDHRRPYRSRSILLARSFTRKPIFCILLVTYDPTEHTLWSFKRGDWVPS